MTISFSVTIQTILGYSLNTKVRVKSEALSEALERIPATDLSFIPAHLAVDPTSHWCVRLPLKISLPGEKKLLPHVKLLTTRADVGPSRG